MYNGASTLNLVAFILSETDAQMSNVFTRGYNVTDLTNRTVNEIQNAIDRTMSNSSTVTAATCAREFTNLVGLTNKPGELIQLPNGNQTSRYKFVFVVESDISRGTKNKYRFIIQGYTDYASVVFNSYGKASLPPDMICYINSITEVIESINSVGMSVARVNQTYQNIASFVNYNREERERFVLARAKDLHNISRVMEDNFEQDLSYGMDTLGSAFTTSAGDIASTSNTCSLRSNQDTSSYLSSVLSSYQEGRTLASVSHSTSLNGAAEVYDNAISSASEPILARNKVIEVIAEHEGSLDKSCFCIKSLMAIFPNFDSVTQVHPATEAVIHKRIQEENQLGIRTDLVVDTGMTDIITSRVLELANSISAHMANTTVWEASMMITRLPGTEVLFEIFQGSSILGDSFTPGYVNKLTTLIRNISLPKFLYGLEAIDNFKIILHTGLFKDTTIDVDVPELGYSYVFRLPTFCDSLYTPVLTTPSERSMFHREITQVYDMISRTY